MTTADILNHLLQSTVFVAVMAGLAWVLRERQARVRFGVWLAASVKFLIPFSALIAIGQWLPWPQATGAAPAAAVAAAAPVVRAVSDPFGTGSMAGFDAGPAAEGSHWWMTALLAIWALGTLVLLARWVWRWALLARMARGAQQRNMEGLRVAVCDGALEPGVFGIWRPVVLLPRDLEQRLGSDELAAVLAHERAHIARRDNLWAALHTLVESLFWFHPGVWWLGRKLVEERETACDESVLAAGGDREAYASGIVSVCRYYVEMPAPCAAGVSGGALRQRVGAILRGQWGERLDPRQKAALWGLGAAVVALPLAAGVLFAQAAGPKAFDAASVRVARVPGEGIPIRFQTDPQRLTVENMSLEAILLRAYRLQSYQIKAPSWMGSGHIDISAETATPASQEQMENLLRPFLVRQFDMKMHWATNTANIYKLTVAPGGLMLHKSKPGTPSHVGLGLLGSDVRFTGAMTMDEFAAMLSQQAGRPVENDTGLSGNYDLDFTFNDGGRLLSGMSGPLMFPAGVNFMISGPGPAGARRGRVPGAKVPGRRGAAAMPTSTQVAAPTLSAALPEELGLRLVATRGPIKVMVIDSARRTPVGN